ncbi:MAG TPA: hypothetical protein DD706_12200 [Nitrospiraceae bacterium]|nr:hypothetical protein [Nitrospiraceae bacterium]
MGGLQLRKRCGECVDIASFDELDEKGGRDIQMVIILKKDGSLEPYQVGGKGRGTKILKQSKNDPGNEDEVLYGPNPPMQEKGVKVSHVVSMVASPGCTIINGKEYYW